MADPVALDFETRSTVDLPRHGGHRYAASPDSEVLCLVARVPGEGDGRGRLPIYYAWSPLPVAFTAHWPEAVGAASRITFNAPAPPDELFAECARRGVVAHNAEGFDRLVWEALGWPEVTWYDSAPRARRAALPGSLDSLGNALDVGGKDAAGAGAMRQFSAPQRISNGAIDEVVRGLRALKKGLPLRRPVPVRLLRALAPGVAVPDPVVWDAAYEPLITSPPYGAEVFLDPDPAQLAAIVRYCARDVWILAESWRLARLGAPHPDDEILALDGVVNRRGICVDLGLVGKLRAEAERIRAEAVAAATTATAGQVTDTTLHSPSALCAWLRKKGYLVPNAQEKAIKAALAGAIDRGDKAAEAVCRARLRVARVSAGKLAAIDDRVCADGRLRGMFSYYGAHTGRWAGRGVQLQNLPRPHDTVTPAAADIAAGQGLAVAMDTIRAVYGDKAADLDEPRLIGSLIRSCLVASPGKWLCYVDYSAIEARGLLWLAEDEAGLDVYRTGGDPYKVLAAAIYGVDLGAVTKPQRQAGKVGVLACGFGGGPKAVARMALKGGIDLAAANTTPAAVVEAWRAKHPHVAGWPVPDGYGGVKTRVDEDGEPRVVRRGGLWKDLERDAKIALNEPTSPYGQTYFHRDGPDLICTLPSGRPIVYRKAQRELVERNGESRMALTYADPRFGRKVLYGGLSAENATQALCRDLLAAAMLRLEARGFPVVGHVHDEVIVEINDPAQKAEVEAIMLDSPPWAAGLPLAVEGVVNRRYGK